jgi:hypothetical protein
MPGKTIVTTITTIPETVKWIKKLSLEASKDPVVESIANECLSSPSPLKCVFDTAYDMMVYRPDEVECMNCHWEGFASELLPVNAKQRDKIYCPECHSQNLKAKQQLRTIENILRLGEGNCTHYATLIAGILIDMGIKFKYRVVGYERPNKYDHIYIVTDSGFILDPVQGQKQDGSETRHARPQEGKFNSEVNYKYKLDYPMPQLEIIQGVLGCTEFKSVGENRITASRLGCLSGYVGYNGVVGEVLEGLFRSKAERMQRLQMRTDRQLAKLKIKHAADFQAPSAPLDATIPNSNPYPAAASGGVSQLQTLLSPDGQSNTPGLPMAPPPSNKIFGMDKTMVMVLGGAAVLGGGIYFMTKKKGKR